MSRNILLFGGGLDSVLYLLELQAAGIPVTCMHVDYGQLAAAGEMASAQYFCHLLNVPLVTRTSTQIAYWQTTANALMDTQGESLFVEGRNLGLVLSAAPLAHTVYLAITRLTGTGIADHKDASARFVDALNTVLACSFSHEVRVSTPWSHIPKEDLVRRYLPEIPTLFERSWTCFLSTTLEECGRCRHCLSKQQLAGVVFA